jgi:hypothetical protein
MLEPAESVEIHIGNSVKIRNVIYKDSRHLLQTLSEINRLEGRKNCGQKKYTEYSIIITKYRKC